MTDVIRPCRHMNLNLYEGHHSQVILQCLYHLIFMTLSDWLNPLAAQPKRLIAMGYAHCVWTTLLGLDLRVGLEMPQSLSAEWKAKWSNWKICVESEGFPNTLVEMFQLVPWKICEKLTRSLNCFFPANVEFFWVP